MTETWVDIKDYEGWYQVSNLGNIKRLKKVHCNHGKRNMIEREHILTPSTDKKGYKVVILSNNGANRKHKKVHLLVAEAFIPNIDNKTQIDHINRDKSDNRVDNLRWVDSFENQRNRNDNRVISAFGFSMCVADWSICLGIKPHTILARLKRGWSAENAVSINPLKEGEYLHGRRN